MRVYSPTGKSYVHIAEISKNEIKKIGIEIGNQPREQITSFYNRQTEKPTLVTNLGMFGMNAKGLPCFGLVSNHTTYAHDGLHVEGLGITDNNELLYGNQKDRNWKDFCSAYPMLIKDGKKAEITYGTELSYRARRTCVGYNDSTIFVICVDSPGMTFTELQNLGISLGIKYLLNGDGGGSSRMMYNGKTITTGLENRAVDNFLVVYVNSTTNSTQGSVQSMSTYLKPDKTIITSLGGKKIKISQKIIPDGTTASKDVCSYVKKGDLVKPNAKVDNGSGKPRGITVHNTPAISVNAATTMAEQYARATYPNLNMGGAMVHYYVSGYDEIWQLLNTEKGKTERGWHASDGSGRRTAHNGSKWSTIGGNLDTIAIECIGNSKEAEDATAILVAYLCKKHGLNPNVDVYTHNYFMGLDEKIISGASKNCPVYILPHLNTFISTVSKYYGNTSSVTIQSIAKQIYRVRKTWSDASSQLGAYYSLDSAKAACKVGYSVFDKDGEIVYSNSDKIDVTYQAYASGKWLGKIENYNNTNSNGYAGIEGKSIQGIKTHLSRGDIEYRVHIKNGTWLNWITNDNNKITSLSYAGIVGKDIDAVQIRLIGDIVKTHEVYYRVSTVGSSGYLNWIKGVSGAGTLGYAGIFGSSIDKIQIYVK